MNQSRVRNRKYRKEATAVHPHTEKKTLRRAAAAGPRSNPNTKQLFPGSQQHQTTSPSPPRALRGQELESGVQPLFRATEPPRRGFSPVT